MASSADVADIVAPGTRVEVRWIITRGEGDEEREESVWWPGVVGDLIKDKHGNRTVQDGACIRQINYEAFGEFDAEECHVVFISEHALKHIHKEYDEEEMCWRQAGTAWEPAEDEEEEMDDEILTIEDVQNRTMSELRESTGLASEDEMINMLQSKVPRERVIEGAKNARTFNDRFREFLAQMHESQGTPVGEAFVVTEDMVHQFVASLSASS